MATEASDSPSKKYRDREWLYEEYVVNDRSTVSMADEVGVAPSTVWKWLKKNNINTDESPTQKSKRFQRLKDEESFRRKYHKEGMTLAEISDGIGVSYTVVNHWFDELGIEKRDRNQIGCGDYTRLDDEAYLRDRYVDSNATISEIADVCNVSTSTVYERLERYEIAKPNDTVNGITRPRQSNQLSNGDLSKLRDRGWLRSHYIEQEMSSSEIAEKTGLNGQTVLNYLHRHGIEVRCVDETGPSGESHHFWKEVITSEYGRNWPGKSLEARLRDQGRCQRCALHDGEHVERTGMVNHVHHIRPRSEFMDEDGNLDYEPANTLDNLITLCSTCHKKLEGLPIDIRS